MVLIVKGLQIIEVRYLRYSYESKMVQIKDRKAYT